ncbi:hypothetical protein L6164_016115 [Bauhinia variegata]|uniref:Uncharacterized protein n=1 Tax=Bauhinia variegata TaxID=167791 RepID=A0ACB9NMN1_BAUVA|nr:hypothetical protein L6164_016115 [Bauhinia variegata]
MFWSSVMGDLIGAESGDNMSSNVDELKGPGQVDQSEEADYSKRTRVRYRNAMTKKYPPPITLLRQTGSLPGRMPWVFKREHSDGRLVIRAERYKRREYLEAHRENGRLIMRLVPADDTVYCDEYGEPITVDIDGEEETEFEDLEETEQVTEREERDDEEEVALASEASSALSQKSCLEDESEHEPRGSLRKCFACAGGMGQDSDPLCKGNGIGVGGGFLGQAASAPIRPITAVV